MSAHEVQTLRQELADNHKKLQEYADTIVSLHGELRTLRESICSTCKRKFVPANLVLSQAAEMAAESSSLNRISPPQSPVERTDSTFSWHGLLKRYTTTLISQAIPSTSTLPHSLPNLSTPTCVPSPPVLTKHGNKKQTLISNPIPIPSSSKAVTMEIVPRVPRWSVRRDDAVDAVLDVTFVCSFDHKEQVRSIRFSADGKYLAAVLGNYASHANGTIIIYDVETRKKYCVLAEYASQYSSIIPPGIKCLCFSPDGRYIVAGDEANHVTVWDIPNKRIRNVFRGHHRSVESVDFSPNGRLVVSASDNHTVYVWNVRDGSAKVFSDSLDGFRSARFSPNGKYVAVVNGCHLRIWDVRSGHPMVMWTVVRETLHSVAFTPDGRGLVSSGSDGVVQCCDVSSLGVSHGLMLEAKTIKNVCKGSVNGVRSSSISPDGRWIASCSSIRTIIWDARSARSECTLIGHMGLISSVDFSPTGSYLALGSDDSHVTLWRYTEI